MKRRVLRLLCLAAFAACVAASFLALRDMCPAWDSWVNLMEPKSASDIRLAAGTLPGLDWAAYAQGAYQALGAESRPERSAKAPILRFIGDSRAVAFFPLCSGRLPRADEADVCAVDRATAFALWNSLDAAGQKLICEKTTYTVVGVVDTDQSLMLLPARDGDELDRLAVRSPDGFEALTAFESALGSAPDAWFLGDPELLNWLLLACAAPLLLLLGCGAARLKRRGGAFRPIGSVLIGCAVLAALLWAVACIPARLLPGRWSDFSFYAEQVRAWQAREPRLPGARDIMRSAGAARVLLLSALTCLALIGERMCSKCVKSHG